MSKKKPELPEGWDVDTFVLAKNLAENSKVLFLYNEDFARIKKVAEMFKLDVTIMNDDPEILEKANKIGFKIFLGNVNAGGLSEINEREYNYVVAENIIHSARYPGDFLKDTTRICDNLVVCNENKAYWKKRLRFLFKGSLYVDNQYEIVPDDEYAWFNKYPWTLSHKDIVHLCSCQGMTIKKGTIIYKDGYIDNMYDIRSYPNMHAFKVYYLITDKSNKEYSYKLGGSIF